MAEATEILCVTTNDVPGYEVKEVFGEVFGLVVRSRNMFSDMGASMRSIVGGEAGGLTKLLMESREQAMERMREEAASKGANAVLAMRYDTGDIFQTMNSVAAYGTAVIIEKKK
jgi:uncharacterized protein YbjQ (UPF0145 family)